jgi:glycosyltransferase involved in cell wall biosynthesis
LKACLLIPNYDHGDEIVAVVNALEQHGLECLVVDDGSGARTRDILERLSREHPWLTIHTRERNGGRGAALMTGYRVAARRGFSHVIQLDADGQHDADDVPRFLAEISGDPDALVLGSPIFDASVPRSRLYGRQLSRLMVWITTLSFDIVDPLCGFRAIPLKTALELMDSVEMGAHMEFDPELLIRLHRRGVPVRTVPTRVVYAVGGLSHFKLVRDSARMTRVYVRSLHQTFGYALRKLRGRSATNTEDLR